jgi:hypothetical protein
MPLLETALAKYGWIWVGLTFGFAAKYALLIKRGVRLQLRLIVADILLLPMVALIAFNLATRVGFVGETSGLITAFCTVGADRLVKLLTDRFLQRVDAEARLMAEETIGRARNAVQSEFSAREIIDDTIRGNAPDEYVALRPHPQSGSKE